MSEIAGPTLSFKYGWDELREADVTARGWCPDAIATLPDGRQYQLTFYDPGRLNQDLKESGDPCTDDPGLVVVPETTFEAMSAAIAHLYKGRFFEHLKPLSARHG